MNELSNTHNKDLPEGEEQVIRRRNKSHVWAGLFILLIGGVLLLRQAGFDLPYWLFTWPMILITVGVLSGIKHRFRPGGWIVMLAIGGIFLSDNMIPGQSIQRIAWPLLIMAVGVWVIFRPKTYRNCNHPRNRFSRRWRERGSVPGFTDNTETYEVSDSNDIIDATSIFGGVKKIILSKNFQGGDIMNFMGGTELNLTQADINGRINIDCTNIFGGTKLIVPSTWDVQSDIVAIFGGVDDKRQMIADAPQPTKIIHLTGTCIFGGIEIRSF